MGYDKHYDRYIAWRRLTRGGKLSREEMPPRAQAEYDSYNIREETTWDGLDLDHEAIKRAYEEAP